MRFVVEGIGEAGIILPNGNRILKLRFRSQADLAGGKWWTYRTFECLINEAASVRRRALRL